MRSKLDLPRPTFLTCGKSGSQTWDDEAHREQSTTHAVKAIQASSRRQAASPHSLQQECLQPRRKSHRKSANSSEIHRWEQLSASSFDGSRHPFEVKRVSLSLALRRFTKNGGKDLSGLAYGHLKVCLDDSS